jgi:uncharacterized protein (TIGR00725 family)
MNRNPIIGIMGPGEKATSNDLAIAEKLGALVARKNWITLTGGRRSGVMEAALKGAKAAGGQTIGILMSKDKNDASAYADIVIPTGMGSARNFINALSSDVIVACGMAAGTASEISLALKEKKPVVLVTDNQAAKDFFHGLAPQLVSFAATPEEAMTHIEWIVAGAGHV